MNIDEMAIIMMAAGGAMVVGLAIFGGPSWVGWVGIYLTLAGLVAGAINALVGGNNG